MTYHSGKVVLLHEDFRYTPDLEYSFELLRQSAVRSRLPSLDPDLHISLLVEAGQCSWRWRAARPCPAGSSTVLYFNHPNLSPPVLTLRCPGSSLLCSLTMVFLSGLHQCELWTTGKNKDGSTEDANLLIWPWCHAYATHAPPWSSLHPSSPPPRVALSALPCHTHFILGALCMQCVSELMCGSTRCNFSHPQRRRPRLSAKKRLGFHRK